MAGCDLEHMVGCDLAANRPFRWAVPALRPYRHIRKSGGVRYREFRARLLDKIAAGLANYIAGSSGEKSQGQFARIMQPGRTPFGQLFASSRPQLPDPPQNLCRSIATINNPDKTTMIMKVNPPKMRNSLPIAIMPNNPRANAPPLFFTQ
jgi:hypothetical protein